MGLDSFAVVAALGAAGKLSGRARWRISVLFVVFEAGMPLIGLAVGAPLPTRSATSLSTCRSANATALSAART